MFELGKYVEYIPMKSRVQRGTITDMAPRIGNVASCRTSTNIISWDSSQRVKIQVAYFCRTLDMSHGLYRWDHGIFGRWFEGQAENEHIITVLYSFCRMGVVS